LVNASEEKADGKADEKKPHEGLNGIEYATV
jgi:hypothetical protein